MGNNSNGPNVLIVHDRLTVPGGGERVIHFMADAFDTTVITGEYEPGSTYDFSHTEVVELPGNEFSEFIKLRKTFDWDEFDVAVFSGNRPQFTLWRPLPVPSIRYCHSPARTFWSLRDRDFRESSLSQKCIRTVVGPIFRTLDRAVTSNHDLVLTNSNNIRSQVDRFYGLEANVLYPPINTSKYNYNESGDFWLSVNRLVPKKRVKKQIQAVIDTDIQLVVVGGLDDKFKSYGEEVIKLADTADNVTIKGFVSDDELRELYANCRGVIYLPYFEDFGIVPIEAMASGKPVVVAAEGGPLETVNHGETGWTIPPRTGEIRSVLHAEFDHQVTRKKCEKRAQAFDVEVFNEGYVQAVQSVIHS